jgi:hypothetical protein
MDCKEIGYEGVNWIQVIQRGIDWRDFVSTTRAFEFCKRGEFLDHMNNYQLHFFRKNFQGPC